ncbi:MAG TPA: ABC transporter permease, partial [Candidatus Acidoferrum sp.]|nr:ABC transporter permease [Candidatus Acidoferrum sp.]
SLVDGVLFKSLPVADADRLVMVYESQLDRHVERTPVAPANFMAWSAQQSVFDGMAAFAEQTFTLSGAGTPESLEGARATAGLFRVLRVEPVLGRAFTDDEDLPGRARVVVLGQRLWQRRFHSAPGAIGQTIRLDGNPHTIVGVMPEGVGFPDRATELWVPAALDFETGMDGMAGRILSVLARLRPGATLETARAEMDVIAKRLVRADPAFNAGLGAAVVPLKEVVVGGFRPVLLVLWAAVGLVLLIACANFANLLLARAVTRQHEVAVRLALGATRYRLIRQFLTESALLALLGGGLGLLLGMWGIDALLAVSPGSIPRAHEVVMDGRVLAFTMLLSLATGIGVGLAPALPSSRLDLTASFKESGRGATPGAGRHRLRNLLVVAETALSLVLLIGAGLMVKSFWRLQAADPGFDPDELLTVRLELPETRYPDAQQVASFHDELIGRIAHMPGVAAVGATNALPMSGAGGVKPVTVAGRPRPGPGEEPLVQYRLVSPDYFRAMGIPLLRGRDFTRRDAGPAAGVVLINQAMARRFWPDQDPLGKRISLGGWDDLTGEVIGVVGDVRHWGKAIEAEPEMYWDHAQSWLARGPTLRRQQRAVTIVVRASVEPDALVRGIRGQLARMDGELPISDIMTMEERLGASLAAARFKTLLFGLFAAVALVLAAIGLYGVMSYAVTQRTQELGIRMALGARSPDLLRLVVGQGLRLVLVGVFVGLAVALAAAPVVSRLLFEVGPTDPATFTVLTLLVIAVALLACYLPARRATRVDPMVALRFD